MHKHINDNLIFPWLERRTFDPFFLYIHTQDVHFPYRNTALWEKTCAAFRKTAIKDLGAGNLERLLSAYDSSIAYTDGEFNRLLQRLSSLPWAGNTVVIVTADHGEEFMEHGGIAHGNSLYDELLRVPLIFAGPGVPVGVRIQSQVRTIDITPTILGLAGIEKPKTMRGESLLPWMSGARQDDLTSFSQLDIGVAIRVPPWKLINNIPAFFNITDDPGERANLLRKEPDALEAAQKLLREWAETVKSHHRERRENAGGGNVAAMLRAAGYLP